MLFGIGSVLWLNYFPQSRIGQRLWFQEPVVEAKASHEQLHLVGRIGITTSPLRPTGIAIIDGRRFDVISRGEFVDRESPVKVVRIQGNEIEVCPHMGE